MLVLFDHGTPRSIARWLRNHTVVEAIEKGWERLSNGALLKGAEDAGFDILLTTDKNIRYQQNLKGHHLAIVVLGNPERPAVERHIDRVIAWTQRRRAATSRSRYQKRSKATGNVIKLNSFAG